MRVVVAHNRYQSAVPSGEDRVVDTESAALKQAGHDVTPFERTNDELRDWSVARQMTLPMAVIRSRRSYEEMVRLLRRQRPDVVHVHNTFPLLTASVLHACATESVPVVVTLHNSRLLCARGDFYRDGRRCRECVEGTASAAIRHGCYRGSPAATVPVVVSTAVNSRAWRRIPAAYIFVSEAHRRAMAQLDIPPERCFVKWNMVPDRERPDGCRKNDLVAYLGRLDDAKGVTLLTAAWDKFKAQGEDSARLRLAIGGDGPLGPAVKEWAQGRDDIEFRGLLSAAASRSLLAEAVAVVVPSGVQESFGLVVAEAMSEGTPVVVSDHGALPEVLGDEAAGWRFAPGDAGGLACVLSEIAHSPAACAAKGLSARAAYERRFDPEENLARLLAIYRFAISNPVRRV